MRALPISIRCLAAVLLAVPMAADEDTPNWAGNRTLELEAEAITDRDRITELMGVDLGEGYVLVKMLVDPQTPGGVDLDIDDFTLIARKNGERGGAMSPSEIAGEVSLVVGGPSVQASGIGTQSRNPFPSSTGVPYPGGSGIGTGPGVEGGLASATLDESARGSVDPRMAPLEAKALRSQQTAEPVEGLLYFFMESQNKPKDLGLVYAGSGGRLVIDFK